MALKPWQVMNSKDYDTYKSNKYRAEKFGDSDGRLNRENSVLRNNYGISADEYSYDDLQRQSAYGTNPYDYAAQKNLGRAKKYAAASNPYTKQKYDLYNELVNFKYDPNNDEVFKAYKDMYTREGTAARDRAYSNASARSEGRNNTWAEAAAAQAQNAYTKKISDVVPSLAERAYQKLVNQYNSVSGFETNADKQNQALYKSELEQYKENSDMADKYRKTAQQQLSDARENISNDISDRYKEAQIAKNNQSMIRTQQEIEKANIELKFLTELEQLKLKLGYLDLESAQALINQRKAQTQKAYYSMTK